MSDAAACTSAHSLPIDLERLGEGAPVDGLRIAWPSLVFPDPDTERDFRADYARRFLSQSRAACFLGAFLFAIFGLLDPYLIPEVKRFAWTLRYAVVCPLFLCALGASYLPRVGARFERVWPPLVVASGLAIIALGVRQHLVGNPHHYAHYGVFYDYAGLMLVCSFAYTFTRLRFLPAVLTSWSVVLLYGATGLAMASPVPALLNNLFFLATANVIGMFASYWMERSVRNDFLQQRLIRRQADELRRALAEVRVLSGLLPICAWCKKVRDDAGYWTQIEEYISRHSNASLTHGICPECQSAVLAEVRRPG